MFGYGDKDRISNADADVFKELIDIPPDFDEATTAIDLGETAEEQVRRYRMEFEDMLRDGYA